MFDNLLKTTLIMFQAVVKTRDSINSKRVAQYEDKLQAEKLILQRTHDDYR